MADAGTVSVSGDSLNWSGPLAAGATATINYSVRVNDAAAAGATLENVAAVDGTLAVLSAEGDAIDRAVQMSTLIEALPPAVPGDPPAADPPGGGGRLPATGLMVTDFLKLAVGLLIAGGGVLIVGRRQRQARAAGQNPPA